MFDCRFCFGKALSHLLADPVAVELVEVVNLALWSCWVCFYGVSQLVEIVLLYFSQDKFPGLSQHTTSFSFLIARCLFALLLLCVYVSYTVG